MKDAIKSVAILYDIYESELLGRTIVKGERGTQQTLVKSLN